MYKAKLVKPREEINYTAGALNPALSREQLMGTQ